MRQSRPGYASAGLSGTIPIVLSLIALDLAAVIASFTIAFLLRQQIPFPAPLAHGVDIYLEVWPIILLWPVFLWREGLYPGLWLTSGDHLRRLVRGTTTTSILAMAATFLTRTGPEFSRLILTGTWAFSLAIFPLFRFAGRRVLGALGVSGPRAVITGEFEIAREILARLRKQTLPAITPVAVFSDHLAKGFELEGVEIRTGASDAGPWAQAEGVRVAVLAIPRASRTELLEQVEHHGLYFPRVLVIPDLAGLSTFETDIRDIQGILALELKKNLLYWHNRVLKMAIDLFFSLNLAILSLPVIALIEIAILIESGRPVFYGHKRVGRYGQPFRAWKFRTMVPDAQEILAAHLEQDLAARQEWNANQKLKDDPRLTRVGRFLRRFSLDELPQIWNILIGEMSLVGPRPIVIEEVEKYGRDMSLYLQVRPGLTGLWQVSGRSQLAYSDRVALDTYYVRNWSIWLDLIILARTLTTVVRGTGAY